MRRGTRLSGTVVASMLLAMVSAPALGQEQAKYPPHAVPRLEGVTIEGLPAVTGRIHVDQFGYLPRMAKFAVISDPQRGYNAADSYTPGDELEVRRRADGAVVLKGRVSPWKDGAVHEDSGDRGWWFDFSAVREPGEYYVFDPKTNLRSPIFRVAEDVYYPVLRAACRMYYYQRLAVPIEARHAEGPWTDDPAMLQDARARLVTAKEDATTARDLAGGWMDAGDTNKYPTFMADVIHPLLYAYENNPKAFGDDYNIPESGNGLPDILDEVKFELEFLKKMQESDGGVFIKMGEIDYGGTWPISKDQRPRYYGPKSSASTLWFCANAAHAARVYDKFEAWKPFAQEMKERALLAWAWYQANPREYKPDTGEIKSGSANRGEQEHDAMEAIAAVHLFALTGEEKYHDVVKKRAASTRQLAEGTWSVYGAGAGEALLDYARMDGADANLARRILEQLRRSGTNAQWAPPADADLYRAWMNSGAYHWGSCNPRSSYGFAAMQSARLTPGEDDKQRLETRAADMLHSFHGVNPLSAVMLSNMGHLGAEQPLMYIYHARWGAGGKFSGNPAPGYVVGGPNQSFSGKSKEGSEGTVEWIRQQPRAKAYADYDLGWPEASWEISEPAIYYQALYIRLLSEFVNPPR